MTKIIIFVCMNSKYGTYETIPISELVAGCKMHLGIKNSTEDDLFLYDLANEGVKQLRNLYTLVPAVATLPIANGKAKLPVGFVRFAKGKFPIRFVQSNGLVNPSTTLNTPIYTNSEFYTDNPFADLEQYLPFTGTVNLVNGYLFFEGNIEESFVKIGYLSTNLDDNGNVVIPAIAERTVRSYVCWCYCRTIKERQDITSAYEWEYKKGKQQLKGLAAMSESFELPMINNLMNKLI